jgi:hypothetical protein
MRQQPSRFFTLFLAAVFSSAAMAAAQDPATPQPQQPESSSAKNAPGQAGRHSDDFLVRGTVFTAEGLTLPGAELRIRRLSDKKPRWETATNSRGDFAIRVKMGADYEVTVKAKGFQDQSIAVDAKTGERYKDLTFRMQHAGAKKS